MALTFNNNIATQTLPKFSQGQLVIISQLPDLTLPPDDQRLSCRLVPPGVRVRGPQDVNLNWPVINLKKRVSLPVTLARTAACVARRRQWPVRYYVSSTIHRIIGETCDRIATQISVASSAYTLWEKEQLIVLVSRVRSLDHITFVGTLNDTLLAIRKLLKQKSDLATWIDKRIETLNLLQDNYNPILEAVPRLGGSLVTCQLPPHSGGFLYIICSVKVRDYHINESTSIRRDLAYFNGTLTTPRFAHGRPWAVVAYATNFQGDPESPEAQNTRVDLYNRLLRHVGIRQLEIGSTDTLPLHEALKEFESFISVVNTHMLENKYVFCKCLPDANVPW